MKPKLINNLWAPVAGILALAYAGPSLGYDSRTPAVNTDISDASIIVEMSGDADYQGAIQASDGTEYIIESTNGNITAINNTAEISANSGFLADGEGSKLTVINSNASSSDGIHGIGRVGVLASNGGYIEMTSAKDGAIYASGIYYDGVNAYKSATIVFNSTLYASGRDGYSAAFTGTGVKADQKGTVICNQYVNAVGSTGVGASNEGKIVLNGKADITGTDSAGLYAGAGGSIEAKQYVVVHSNGTGTGSYGICSGSASSGGVRSSVVLNGATVTVTAQNRVALAAANTGTITGNMAKYDIMGNLYASNGGELSLATSGKSRIQGATLFKDPNSLVNSTGIINLNLQGETLWNVTGNSQLTNLTLGQGSALQFAFSGTSLADIISATDTITLEAGSVIYLTGDISALQGGTFDFFSGTVDNRGVKFVGFDGTDWVEYEYTQTPGTNTFAFSADAPTVIEEPGFIPEPATATLGLFGLASLLFRRRKG